MEQLNNEELFNRFKVIYDAKENADISHLSQLYGVRLTKAGRFNNQDTKELRQMRKERTNSLPSPPQSPMLTPYLPHIPSPLTVLRNL